MSLAHTQPSVYDYGNNNFTVNFNFRFGIEMEYILPFNANKWSVIAELVYRYHVTEDTWETNMVPEGLLIANVNYHSIDIPVGVRHYFHLGGNSKAFINLSYMLNFPINSTFDLTRTDGIPYRSREILTSDNFAIGAGYKFKDKYIIEIRYETNRQILKTHANWKTDFATLSVIFGYTI